MQTTLRVLLVDDHEIVRLGLRALLEQAPYISIIGEAETAEAAIKLCAERRPNVVIMDIRMPPGKSGLEACRVITERWPKTQVIMLTSYVDDELIAEAIQAGAVGYVLKQGGTGELMRALDAIRHGAAALDPSVTRRVMAMLRQQAVKPADPFRTLTRRELDILWLIAEGHTNREIAERLYLSEKTVRNHITTLFDKLGVSNRVEAATFAIVNRLGDYARDDWRKG